MADKTYIPRLKQHYDEVLKDALVKQFGYENKMQVPRLDKVVLNMGVGEGVADSKKVNAAAADLVGTAVRDVLAVESYGAEVGTLEARDEVEERRLAGAVRTDDAHQLAGRNRERDVAVGDEAAEPLRQPGYRQQTHAARRKRRMAPTRPAGCTTETTMMSAP